MKLRRTQLVFFLRKVRERNENTEDENWEKKGASLELNDIRRSPLLEKQE